MNAGVIAEELVRLGITDAVELRRLVSEGMSTTNNIGLPIFANLVAAVGDEKQYKTRTVQSLLVKIASPLVDHIVSAEAEYPGKREYAEYAASIFVAVNNIFNILCTIDVSKVQKSYFRQAVRRSGKCNPVILGMMSLHITNAIKKGPIPDRKAPARRTLEEYDDAIEEVIAGLEKVGIKPTHAVIAAHGIPRNRISEYFGRRKVREATEVAAKAMAASLIALAAPDLDD